MAGRLRAVARGVVTLCYRLISTVEIAGLENVPMEGPFIAAANHVGRLDVGLIIVAFPRPDVVLMIAEKYKKYALYRWLVKNLDLLWVDRFNADLAVVRGMQKRLKAGQVLAIAPEGTRSATGAMQEGWPGAVFIAATAGAPIYPVGLVGTRDREVLANLKRLKRTKIMVTIGRPIVFGPLPRENREAEMAARTAELMCQIAALVPEDYRGVYADHPRLQEILAERGLTGGLASGKMNLPADQKSGEFLSS